VAFTVVLKDHIDRVAINGVFTRIKPYHAASKQRASENAAGLAQMKILRGSKTAVHKGH
jgi:hypothetical protein